MKDSRACSVSPWIVTAAPGDQIAGTVNVRQGTVAVASPRPRACQVP